MKKVIKENINILDIIMTTSRLQTTDIFQIRIKKELSLMKTTPMSHGNQLMEHCNHGLMCQKTRFFLTTS